MSSLGGRRWSKWSERGHKFCQSRGWHNTLRKIRVFWRSHHHCGDGNHCLVQIWRLHQWHWSKYQIWFARSQSKVGVTHVSNSVKRSRFVAHKISHSRKKLTSTSVHVFVRSQFKIPLNCRLFCHFHAKEEGIAKLIEAFIGDWDWNGKIGSQNGGHCKVSFQWKWVLGCRLLQGTHTKCYASCIWWSNVAIIWQLVADHLIKESGVRPLLHCMAVEAIMDGDTIKVWNNRIITIKAFNWYCLQGIITESKSGRKAILADRVIDCTGDADVAHLAGAEYRCA